MPVATDAGPNGPDAPPLAPAAPAPAERPRLVPCAAGWTEVAAEVPYCVPWPDAAAECASGQLRTPGRPECRPVGDPCAGEFAPAPPGRSARFVRAGAAAGGDGTLSRPFATIAEAMAPAPVDVILLSTGTHSISTLALPGGAALIGACAAETIVDATGATDLVGAIGLSTGVATVRGLSLRSSGVGVLVTGSGELGLDGVIVAAARNAGLTVDGARARLVATDTWVRGVEDWMGAATTTVTAVALRGGRLELVRSRIEADGEVGIRSSAGRAAVVLRESVVDVEGANALYVSQRGSIDLDGSYVIGAHEAVAFTRDDDSVLSLVGTTFDVTGAAPPDSVGILSGMGADLRMARVVVRGGSSAVFVLDGTASVEDSLVTNNVPGERAFALSIARASSATLARFAAIDVHGGIQVLSGAVATASDLHVSGMTASRADGFGGGVAAIDRATLNATRVAVSRSAAGIEYLVGATGTLEDVVVAETTGASDRGIAGEGILVGYGASITLRRAAIEGARAAGVIVQAEGASLVAEDVAISRTTELVCPSGCVDLMEGSGIVVLEGTARVDRFSVRESAFVGMRVLRGGTLDASNGVVAESPIGLDLQVDPYDLARVSSSVVYVDNDRNLARSTLPEPVVIRPTLP